MIPTAYSPEHVTPADSVASAPRETLQGLEGAVPANWVARRHPDRQTAWVIVLLVQTEPGMVPPAAVLHDRLERARPAFPLMSARLQGAWWIPDAAPGVTLVGRGDPLTFAPLHHFVLDREPPLRVVASLAQDWLLLCAHHFAFDGLGMVSLVRSLLTGEGATAAPDYSKTSSPRRPLREAVRRLCFPADPIAASSSPPPVESFVARQVDVAGSAVTARLAAAAAAAGVAHNTRRGRPIGRIGLSVAVGGVGGESATYRRLDVVPRQDIAAAVADSLADPRVPPELVRLPPGASLLQPVLHRLSDTLLVSNLGQVELPGATNVAFYPVARGRSAVALGAIGLPGRPATLTLRARSLSAQDAWAFLDYVVEEMARHRPAGGRSVPGPHSS